MLFLRLALGVTVIAGSDQTLGRLALAAPAVMVIVGTLTPLVATLIAGLAVGSGIWAFAVGEPPLFDRLLVHALATAVATAVALIGPGAYSVDARVFGWRELRMPERGQDRS